MLDKNLLEIETQGYKAGYNPMFGKFTRKFDFAPVPYGHRNRQQFVTNVQTALADIQYVYFGEVKLDIVLYLDEQKRLETPKLADMDNYAKLLCDSLKGTKGLLIDDSQIQSLLISWIDTPHSPHFEISVEGNPDNYIMKPLSLYEMPNNLFYPISHRVWTKNGIENMPSDQMELFLAALYEMIRNSRNFRHKLRQSGKKTLHAFWDSRGLLPILAGFHKSRIVDSGFDICHMKEWKAKFPLENLIAKITNVIREVGPSDS